MAGDPLERLIRLFNLSDKREIERYCRDLVITSEDLSGILLTGRVAGLGPYKYACHFAELMHESLQPTQEQLDALGSSGVGRLTDKALKAVRKIDQIFQQRRLLAVHLFYTPSQKFWHMFYFDQRDYGAESHWKHGPHIELPPEIRLPGPEV